jgi:hypothetical protein
MILRTVTHLAKDTFASSRNQVTKNANQEVGHWEAEYLADNDIVGPRGISLQVRRIGNKGATTSKSKEEKLEDQPRLFRTVNSGRLG